MPDRENRFPRVVFVGVAAVVAGALSGVPEVRADEGDPKVVTVPDIPEILRQADWVHEQRAQERERFEKAAASLEGGPPTAGAVTVEGAPGEPAASGEVLVEGAPAEPAAPAAAAPAEPGAPVAKAPAEPEPAANPAPAAASASAGSPKTGPEQDAAGLAAGGSATAPKPAPPSANEAAAEPAEAPAAEAPSSEAPQADASASASAPAGEVQPPYELEIRATARQVWVWISVDDGPQQAVSLEQGETAKFQAEERYVLTVDDAGGVEASLNGRALPSFGGKAQAKRDLVIPSPDLQPIG